MGNGGERNAMKEPEGMRKKKLFIPFYPHRYQYIAYWILYCTNTHPPSPAQETGEEAEAKVKR